MAVHLMKSKFPLKGFNQLALSQSIDRIFNLV